MNTRGALILARGLLWKKKILVKSYPGKIVSKPFASKKEK